MALIITIIAFIIVLGGVVFVHELGHFLAAKKTGVKVEEFVLGFPPLIYKKQIGETLYGIGLIPLGGYNKLLGEDINDPNAVANPRSYESQKPMVKFWIIISGVLMNLILAVAVFYFLGIYSNFLFKQPLSFSDYRFPAGQQQNRPMFVNQEPGSSAESFLKESGLASREIVLSANGQALSGYQEFFDLIEKDAGQPMDLKLENLDSGQQKNLSVVFPKDQIDSLGMIDVAFLTYKTPLEKAAVGFLHAYNVTNFSFSAIGRIINISVVQKTAKLLGNSFVGPVGIYVFTKVTIDYGWLEMINLLAIISLALATTNILPLPVFDGGKIVFIVLQAIDKKRFSLELQAKIEQGGVVVLICLAVLITIKDIFVFKGMLF